jgi:hypothetical protein
MRRLFSRFAPFVILFAFSGRAAADPPFPMGINLAGVTDWSTEFPFADVFKTSRPWVSQKQGQPWGKGGELKTEKGWVKELAPAQFAEALMFVDMGNRYPGGKYVCLYEGAGTIEFGHAAKVGESKPGRIELEVLPERGMLTLKVTKTPVDKIRVIPADLEKDGKETTPFRPAFLKRYEGFAAVRFMDWQRTNNSKQAKWDQRAKPDDATQTSDKGVAIEHCVALANEMKADPWFCIPHLADDDYVEQFANLIQKELAKDRKVYIEYSNETWNGQFEQARYCARKGKELGLSENGYEGQLRYSAQRSVEIFKIFEKVFGGKDRLVRVLAAQSVNPWTGTTAMDWKDAAKSADAIAIAPYFGGALGDPKTADEVAALSVDQILDRCAESIESNKKHLAKYAEEAKKRKLKLMAYEAGQHLAGHGGAENNEKLTKLFHEANRHPRMKDLYLQDMKNWAEAGGDTYCLFSSVGRYSKWGAWGLKEYDDDDDAKAPKLQAVRDVIAGRGK